MKTYWLSGSIAPQKEASGQLHAPSGALGTHCIGGWVGARAGLDAGIETQPSSP